MFLSAFLTHIIFSLKICQKCANNFFYSAIDWRTIKIEREKGLQQRRECEFRYEFTLTQQNTWILAYEGFDGEGWWRVEITIWFICIVKLSTFLFRGSRCGYCSILMGAWHQGCRSVEVNIYPSAITAMPYSGFLWLLCVGNAISRNKLIVIRIYFYIIIF